jgi:hypothetical protein
MDPGKSFAFRVASDASIHFSNEQIGIFKINFSRSRFVELQNRPSGGGFATTGFTHQTKSFSLVNIKRDPINSMDYTNLTAYDTRKIGKCITRFSTRMSTLFSAVMMPCSRFWY